MKILNLTQNSKNQTIVCYKFDLTSTNPNIKTLTLNSKPEKQT